MVSFDQDQINYHGVMLATASKTEVKKQTGTNAQTTKSVVAQKVARKPIESGIVPPV